MSGDQQDPAGTDEADELAAEIPKFLHRVPNDVSRFGCSQRRPPLLDIEGEPFPQLAP